MKALFQFGLSVCAQGPSSWRKFIGTLQKHLFGERYLDTKSHAPRNVFTIMTRRTNARLINRLPEVLHCNFKASLGGRRFPSTELNKLSFDLGAGNLGVAGASSFQLECGLGWREDTPAAPPGQLQIRNVREARVSGVPGGVD